MQLIRDVKGISRLVLLFLLLVAFAFGALLSYVWTMGFYAPSEFHLPQRPTIVIENVEFDEQDATFVDVTVLNPSYSPSDAVISRIQARTTDDNTLHALDVTSPLIPYVLGRGRSQTFTCSWNWANYTGIMLPPSTGKNVEIHVVLVDDMGEIAFVAKPFVSLSITDAVFNSTVPDSFKVTIRNPETSVTYVNVTSIVIDEVANFTADMITPSLPYGLAPGDTAVTFTVTWPWVALSNQTVTITVGTLQGYIGRLTTTP
jgi:hypothetical protein